MARKYGPKNYKQRRNGDVKAANTSTIEAKETIEVRAGEDRLQVTPYIGPTKIEVSVRPGPGAEKIKKAIGLTIQPVAVTLEDGFSAAVAKKQNSTVNVLSEALPQGSRKVKAFDRNGNPVSVSDKTDVIETLPKHEPEPELEPEPEPEPEPKPDETGDLPERLTNFMGFEFNQGGDEVGQAEGGENLPIAGEQ